MAPNRDPDRVLVRVPNWLGDMVISLGALGALRERFGEAHLAVLAKAPLASFYEGSAYCNEVIPYAVRRGPRGMLDRKRVAGELAAKRFDLAVVLPNSFDAALTPCLARIPRRVGRASAKRSMLLTEAVEIPKDKKRHERFQYLALAVALGAGADAEAPPKLVPYPPAVQHMRALLGRERTGAGPLVALPVSAAYGPAKRWPAANAGALVRLLAERGAEAVLVGTKKEARAAEAVLRQAGANARAVNAVGRTSVAELVALLSLCAGFAGNDSGAMHVAAALGIPTVGLFGSTDPVRTGPLGPRTSVIQSSEDCAPCRRRTCRLGEAKCLAGIAPEAVLARLAELGAFGGPGA